ncbi:MAG: hypothetical protein OJF50_000747 [Nitrospira sp.]|jgi:hypothetical protein|nr:hypothetical protein [Nitrospira sp.]
MRLLPIIRHTPFAGRTIVAQHDGGPATAFSSRHGHFHEVFLVLHAGQADRSVDGEVKERNGAINFLKGVAEMYVDDFAKRSN